MKRDVLFAVLLALGTGVFCETFHLSGIDVTFSLPQLPVGERRTEPFTVVRADSKDREGVLVKFPQIYSTKYKMLMTGNLSIQTEKVPDGVSSKDFFLSYLHYLSSMPGNYANGDDDLFLGTSLPGEWNALLKNDNGKLRTYIYMLCSLYKGVGIVVLFEVSDDLYVFCRPITQEIVKSIAVK